VEKKTYYFEKNHQKNIPVMFHSKSFISFREEKGIVKTTTYDDGSICKVIAKKNKNSVILML
jgi:hypothetical protein